MKILLVDDEKLQLTRLVDTVRKVLPEAELFSFQSSEDALASSSENQYDIAFLDIEMPGINGINLAKSLKSINPKINLIFVTAYDNYALEAYKLHASGYVTKPVNEEKIKNEIDGLRYDIEIVPTKKLQIKCFGNFDIFYKGKPVAFKYQKSKELFAYLVDREGSSINVNELNAILWEEDHKSYFRNLVSDIQTTLKSINCEDVFIKRHNACSIDVSKVDCDAYEYRKGNPDAIRMYRGEYMYQYSWPVFNDEPEY